MHWSDKIVRASFNRGPIIRRSKLEVRCQTGTPILSTLLVSIPELHDDDADIDIIS
jgi:hypothetical protein